MFSKRMEVFSKPWGKENPSQGKENPNFSLPRIEPFQPVKPKPGKILLFSAAAGLPVRRGRLDRAASIPAIARILIFGKHLLRED
jgi:hypothetical protein